MVMMLAKSEDAVLPCITDEEEEEEASMTSR